MWQQLYLLAFMLASTAFLSGAADQVAYTYKKLGGDVWILNWLRAMYIQLTKKLF
jgi:hypothetical protein